MWVRGSLVLHATPKCADPTEALRVWCVYVYMSCVCPPLSVLWSHVCPCRDAVLMVMLLKVLRHEVLFYAGMLQGRANKEILDKVRFRVVLTHAG